MHQINHRKIDAAHKKLDEAKKRLTSAEEAYTSAILDEARRIVAEHNAKIAELRAAERTASEARASVAELEEQERGTFGLYQRAEYEDDAANAKKHKAAGKTIRKKLQTARKAQQQAEQHLAAMRFDEAAWDASLRYQLSDLRNLVRDYPEARLEIENLGKAARVREAARVKAERLAEGQARKAERKTEQEAKFREARALGRM